MDPASATVLASAITSTVSALAAYMQYRVGMKQAEQNGEAAPEKPEQQTLEKGEQALVVVQKAVAEHGNEDERADLASFERNPLRYEAQLIRVIEEIATRDQAFANQILKLQPQVGNDVNQGSVTLNDNSSVKGVVGGVIQGTKIDQTFKE